VKNLNGKHKLNARQERFVHAYLADPNATRAAQAAGYSAKVAHITGHKLLRNAKVAAYVDEAQAKAAEAAGVSAEDVLRGLVDEAKYRGDGSSHAARVSAWTALAKHFGMFTEKREHSGQITVQVVYEDMAPVDDGTSA
jgi:phage terminase small subunit